MLPDTDEEESEEEKKGLLKIRNNNLIENDLWRRKMMRFAKIYVFSDSEDETHDNKIKKKNFKSDYNNFLKQNRSQTQLLYSKQSF